MTVTKFDELCAAFAESRSKFFKYRDECLGLATKLISGLVQYLEIPRDCVSFVPLDKEPEPDRQYHIIGAMHLDDDTFWHVGVQLRIYEAPNVSPWT